MRKITITVVSSMALIAGAAFLGAPLLKEPGMCQAPNWGTRTIEKFQMFEATTFHDPVLANRILVRRNMREAECLCHRTEEYLKSLQDFS